MLRDYRTWVVVVCFAISAKLAYPIIFGESVSPVREDELQEFVFVCRESGEKFVLRAKQTYEKNPKTGRNTLVPGLYCEECGKWRASAPVAVLQQNPSARRCPIHKKPMSAFGPQESPGSSKPTDKAGNH